MLVIKMQLKNFERRLMIAVAFADICIIYLFSWSGIFSFLSFFLLIFFFQFVFIFARQPLAKTEGDPLFRRMKNVREIFHLLGFSCGRASSRVTKRRVPGYNP